MATTERVRPVRGLPAVQPLALLAQAIVLGGEVGDVGAQLRHATQQIEVFPAQLVR